MDIHEYQAKKILSDFGVSIPRGGIAYSPENAENKAREIGGTNSTPPLATIKLLAMNTGCKNNKK